MLHNIYTQSFLYKSKFESSDFKGELQRQNKLISSKSPFKILQNEIKTVKIRQAVLEIFNFKDIALDSFPRKKITTETPKILFSVEVLQKLNNRFCDITNENCTIKQ